MGSSGTWICLPRGKRWNLMIHTRCRLPKKSKTKSQKRDPDSAPFCRVLGNVSEALGLRENFLEKVESVPDDILCHRGVKGLVPIYIESAYYDIEEESLKKELSEKLLKEVGFTDSTVKATLLKRSKMIAQHLEPLDFILRFVEDEYKYNPFLTENAQEYDGSIPDNTEVLNFADYSNDEQNDHCEVSRLFHGTDLYSAIDIMKNGIDLDFGSHKHDFSDGGGFYLTTSFEHAETWAHSQTRKAVVLELKIPKTCLEKARILDLKVSEEEGRSAWDRVVRENRSGRPSKKLRQELKEYDGIMGPMSVPSQDHAGSDKRVPEFGSHQLCVVTRRFADEIKHRAKYTLYTELQE